MASTSEFIRFVVGQASGAGEVSARKMMGDCLLYCDGKLVALICDNQLFVKPTRGGRALLNEVTEEPPYPGAKPCYLVGDLDDRDRLAALLRATWDELPFPPPKKPRKKKTKD